MPSQSISRGPTVPGTAGDGSWLIPLSHPEHAYVEDGIRNLDVERSVYPADNAIVYDDTLDRRDPIAVQLNLTAEGVEWLLDQLDDQRQDRFVRCLTYARDLAKVIAWDRATGRVA